MFYSPHYHRYAEKTLFSFASLFCVFRNLQTFFPGITRDSVFMDRHEKGQHTGGSVLVFPQNRHVGRVSQTTKK